MQFTTPRIPPRIYAALFALGLATAAAQAQTFKIMHTFATSDGPQPELAALMQDTNGELYGTTQDGGLNGQGSIFRMTLGGTVTTVYSFCAPGTAGNCVDATTPGALVLGANGRIYGTTAYGGGESAGSVFEMTQAGAVTGLSFFCGVAPDGDNACGAYPVGALVQATNGIFWGVTQGGGILGQGAKYEIGPNGKLGSVSSFSCIEADCNGEDYLVAGLIQGTDGSFYGTTERGGTGAFGGGQSGSQSGGSVFKISANGTLTTLYSFCSLSDCTDGQAPMGALVEGTDGNFYGTTAYGGTGTACYNGGSSNLGCGTVFNITPSGTLTTLHGFCEQTGCKDGQNPEAGLILGSDGNFYGTTHGGGNPSSGQCSDYVCGTIFEITSTQTLTTLYRFCDKSGCDSGGGPVAPLVQDTDGSFYGTTTVGGNIESGNGTIFRLSTGLGPFIKTVPTAGLVGAEIMILGTDLTGTTSVSFNGTAAAFSLVSAALIKATVPAGATSGVVQVTTPSATLNSNLGFVVEP
jgi:uncharacterized repeat protein (TIGR03803 family)